VVAVAEEPGRWDRPVAKVLRSCRHSFYIVFVISFVVELLSVAPMIYMWTVFDRVLTSRSLVTLVSLTVLMVGVYIFWGALDWLRTRLLVRVSLRLDWDLAADVFDASFRRSVGRRGVNVQLLLGDLITLRQFTTGEPLLALISAPFAVIFIAVGWLMHPYLAYFIGAAVVIMLISAYATEKMSAPILKAANDENAEATLIASAGLRQAEATLALGMMPQVRSRWYDRHRSFLGYSVNASEASGLLGGVATFIGRAIPSLTIALAAWLAIRGEITGGMLIAASMLIGKAIGPLQKLMSSWKEIIGARQAYERLNALLFEDSKLSSRMQLPSPKGRLDVIGAAAAPPGATNVVVGDVTFSIQPGEAVAVVGPSASGKSSLTRLLVGVWQPALGSVRLDGVELSEWNHDEVGPHIGYVPQEVEFQSGTVAENIARLKTVDSEKVIEAAKLIDMHETILSFPEGYDTPLGDTGFALSGGQRQRIGIARAFYGSPKYIVMDEPNSSLDEVGENALMKAIVTLKEQGTSFAITTHRPRLLSVVDNLLVLRQGRQVGFGPAAEMLAAIRNLKNAQAQRVGTAGAQARKAASLGIM